MRGSRAMVLVVALAMAVGACSGDQPNVRPSTASATTATPSPVASKPGDAALRCEPGSKRDCTTPGTVRWSLPLPGEYRVNGPWLETYRAGDDNPAFPPRSGSGVASGLVVHTDGVRVLAIELATGVVRWQRPLNAPPAVRSRLVSPTPIIGDGLVAVVFSTGPQDGPVWVATFDLATGERVGAFTLTPAKGGRRFEKFHAIVGGLLWLSSYGSGSDLDRGLELHAFDARTGTLRHQAAFPDAQPIVLDGVLYGDDAKFGPNSMSRADDQPMRNILRFDLRAGQPLRTTPLPTALRSMGDLMAAVAPGVLVVANWQPRQVSAIDARTGALLWTEQTNAAGRDAVTCDVAGVEPPRLIHLCGPAADTVTTYDLRTGKAVGQTVHDSKLRESSVVAGRFVEWTFRESADPAELRVRSLAGDRILGEVEVIGFRSPLAWPSGRFDVVEIVIPEPLWIPDGQPVGLGLGCAPDGYEEASSVCAKPRLFAYNR